MPRKKVEVAKEVEEVVEEVKATDQVEEVTVETESIQDSQEVEAESVVVEVEEDSPRVETISNQEDNKSEAVEECDKETICSCDIIEKYNSASNQMKIEFDKWLTQVKRFGITTENFTDLQSAFNSTDNIYKDAGFNGWLSQLSVYGF